MHPTRNRELGMFRTYFLRRVVSFCVVATIVSFFVSCSQKQDFSLIPVKSADKWGYVDAKGKYVINPQFNNADWFYDGLAKVESTDGKIGYIDKSGKYKIAAAFKSGTAFCEDFAFVVSEGGHPTCIDKKGNIKFVLKEAERVYAFTEGLALFSNKDDKYGFVDKTGKVIVNPQFDDAVSFFEGFAAVKQDDKWGFIDINGKLAISPQFKKVDAFSEGKAAFYDGKKWGYIDTKGAYIINPQFDAAYSFSEGLALVKQGDLYGFINPKGEFEINPQFESAFNFFNGLATVLQGKSYGFINKTGKYEVNPQFEMSFYFYGNIAPVASGDKIGFIDKKGKYVINPQFDEMRVIHKVLWKFEPLWVDYIKSDYYDASEFINLFFKKYANTVFDSISATTTLAELAEHAIYAKDLKASDKYCAESFPKKEITKDISLYRVSFHFNAPIYKEVANYESYWGYSYKSGTKKEYNFTQKPAAIEYQFNCTGKAYGKTSAIVNALKTKIEEIENTKMESAKNKYFLFQDNGKLSFVILCNDNYYSVSLFVSFNKNGLKSLLSDDDDVVVADDVVVDEAPIEEEYPE